MHLYLHSECEFSICFKVVFLRNVIFRDFKNPVNLRFALYGQYTIGFLNSVYVLRDRTFLNVNTVCALDCFLPFHSKFFSMPD